MVYTFWRDPANLARVFDRRVTVTTESPKRSRWTVRAPGRTVEWEAEITSDVPKREIAWKSVPDAKVVNSGSVRFEPLENGTATHVTFSFEVQPPGGLLGAPIGAMLRHVLEAETESTLARLKRELEQSER